MSPFERVRMSFFGALLENFFESCTFYGIIVLVKKSFFWGADYGYTSIGCIQHKR